MAILDFYLAIVCHLRPERCPGARECRPKWKPPGSVTKGLTQMGQRRKTHTRILQHVAASDKDKVAREHTIYTHREVLSELGSTVVRRIEGTGREHPKDLQPKHRHGRLERRAWADMERSTAELIQNTGTNSKNMWTHANTGKTASALKCKQVHIL